MQSFTFLICPLGQITETKDSRTPSFFRKKFKATIVAATIASLALGGLVAAPAHAAPVQQSASVQRAFGDGTWTPSHDESTRVIPLCKGPVAVAQWLYANFADHGADIEQFIRYNKNTLEQLASGKLGPIRASAMLARVVVQVPSYAISDGLFHLPATALSLATGCKTIKDTNSNPFWKYRSTW